MLIRILCLALLALPPAVAQPPLSDEGERRRDAHEFLFNDFARDRDVKWKGEGDDRVLDEIKITAGRWRPTDGEIRIELPAEASRVMGMFRYVIVYGENIAGVESLTLLPFAPETHAHLSGRDDTMYRAQIPSTPVPEKSMPAATLVVAVKPEGPPPVITSVALNSQGKLRRPFQWYPYANLGEDQPRTPVPIAVMADGELIIGAESKSSDLQRERWFRYYATPGQVGEKLERWAAERNFLPGRQILKLQPALVKGYRPDDPKLQPVAGSAAADLSFFERYRSGGRQANTIQPFDRIDYAMCFDEWPKFMSVQGGGRGTPLVENFQHAAELAAAVVEDEINDAGWTAKWWEVKNESSIKAEWDYHWRKDVNGWDLNADFHNQVADAIHRRASGVKVGGPTSAWMQVQVNDFGLYEDQRRFMELTGGHLDFYSHHFYEDVGTIGASYQGDRYTNYLLGRFEAILDMLRADMVAQNNVKPIVISECGSLQSGTGPSDNWLRLRSYSAFLIKAMQRPDQIDLLVPFIFLDIPWNPTSGDASFAPGPGGELQPTVVSKFFDLWRDFDGRRLPVRCEHPMVDVVAVATDDAVRVAVCNMGPRRLAIDLGRLAKQTDASEVVQRRLFYRDGEVRYVDAERIGDPSAIEVDVEETTVVTFSTQPPTAKRSMRMVRHVAPQTVLRPADLASPIQVPVRLPKRPAVATLVIGVQRDGGLAEPVVGTFNGKPFQATVPMGGQQKNLFAPVRIAMAPDDVLPRNEVRIQPIPGGVVTSVHVETLHGGERQ